MFCIFKYNVFLKIKKDENLMYWSLKKIPTKELTKIEIILINLKFNYGGTEFCTSWHCKAAPCGVSKGKDYFQGLSENCLGCVLQSTQKFSKDTQEKLEQGRKDWFAFHLD